MILFGTVIAVTIERPGGGYNPRLTGVAHATVKPFGLSVETYQMSFGVNPGETNKTLIGSRVSFVPHPGRNRIFGVSIMAQPNLWYANNQDGMLALQYALLADLCYRYDLDEVFQLVANPPSVLSNWTLLTNSGGGGGSTDATIVSPLDGSGNVKVAVESASETEVTQGTSPWVTADEHITANLNQDGSGNVGVNVENTPNIDIASPLDGSGNVKVSIQGTPTADVSITSPVDGSGYVETDVKTSVLPTNAAQETGGNLAGIKTDTDTIAGAVSSSKMNVNVQSPVDGSGYVEVDLKTALPAGTNLIGEVEVTDGTNVLLTASHPGYIQGTVTAQLAPISETFSSPTAATVGTSSAQVVASNSSRLGLILINTSGNAISLGFGNPAVLYSGVTLGPYGVYEMDLQNFTTAAINAIASAGSSNLAIQEIT